MHFIISAELFFDNCDYAFIYNILSKIFWNLLEVLAQVPFTAGKAELDWYLLYQAYL